MRKTKSGHGSDCGFGSGFSEKKESRNISLHSFSLVAFTHYNDRSYYNGINRPSGAYTAFWVSQKAVYAPDFEYSTFFRCRILLSSRCHPLHSLHFCTMAQSIPSRNTVLGSDNIPIFTLGIFAFSESVKMQCVQGGNYWNPLARNHCISCIICIFKSQNAESAESAKPLRWFFLFIAPKPCG